MSHEKLKALIERAKLEHKVIYCPRNEQFYTPAEFEKQNSNGKLLWAIEHFELRNYLNPFHEIIGEKKKEPKGIASFSVAGCGVVRVMTSDISFWYYDKKGLQTMLHLKHGDCLRVEENIDSVDQKIMESKEPAIGKELAEFWEEILMERHKGLNENGK